MRTTLALIVSLTLVASCEKARSTRPPVPAPVPEMITTWTAIWTPEPAHNVAEMMNLVQTATSFYWFWSYRAGGFAPDVLQLTKEGGTPRVAISGGSVYNLYADRTHLYLRGHDIMRTPDPGGDPINGRSDDEMRALTIVSGSNIGDIGAIGDSLALDDEYLYWTQKESLGKSPTSAIWRSNKDGTNRVRLASGQEYPMILVADDEFVYWQNTGPLIVNDGQLMRVAKHPPGTPEWIADVSADDRITNRRFGVAQQRFGVTNQHFYWTTIQDEVWITDKKAGSKPVKLPGLPDTAVVSEGTFYWVVNDTTTIMRASPPDFEPVSLVDVEDSKPQWLSARDGHLYWFCVTADPDPSASPWQQQWQLWRMKL